MRPLAGITVVSIEHAVAAPFATRQLADLGARVIKVERPGPGDFARRYDETVHGYSSYFVWLNRSKESLCLDLKHPEASRILHRLLATSDVFVQNLAPGAATRLGLGAADLLQRFPRLIVCDVSGYGSSGPYRDKKAYDLLIQAETGLMSVTGTPETAARVGISVADISAGMYAFSGILAALFSREQTGQGSAVEVSLFDALGEWMSQPAYYAAYGGERPERTGPNHPSIAPYGPFETSDEIQVFIGVQNEREWVRLCEIVLRQPEVATDARFSSNSRRVANREIMDGMIRVCWRDLTADDVISRLEEAQIAYARMNSVQEYWDHPQIADRQRWSDVDSPVGRVRATLPPITIRGVEARMDPIPAPGQHTDVILSSLGYSHEEIEQLRRDNGI